MMKKKGSWKGRREREREREKEKEREKKEPETRYNVQTHSPGTYFLYLGSIS
jgi:hypothetical protein